ncbi:HIT domain-containing protein [candidate division WOR-3 bacterium]|nr:HIT domain-containing protein [candidate division WOR-3 bacterium]
MKRIFAPWRYKYISNPNSEGCIFCNAASSNDDRKSGVLFRGKFTFVIMNKYPYNNGHIMIAPYNHTGDFEELSDKEMLEMSTLIQEWQRVIKKAMKPEGFNIGMNLGRIAGAGFENHLHYHLVPRWSGDTNFMPIIGQTKVVPISIDDAYDLLLEVYKEKFVD